MLALLARRLLVGAALVASACATGHPDGSGALAIECNVPEALLVIDDVTVGRVSEWKPPGQAIRPGFRRVEIRQPGYFSHYAEIDLKDGGAAAVRAHLHPQLD
jgi:hypothetical protein